MIIWLHDFLSRVSMGRQTRMVPHFSSNPQPRRRPLYCFSSCLDRLLVSPPILPRRYFMRVDRGSDPHSRNRYGASSVSRSRNVRRAAAITKKGLARKRGLLQWILTFNFLCARRDLTGLLHRSGSRVHLLHMVPAISYLRIR